MPTVTVGPQAGGLIRDVDALFGAATIPEAVDDSLDTTHDSDATYVELISELSLARHRFSVPMFGGMGALVPNSVMLRVAARRLSPGLTTSMVFGFARAAGTTLDAASPQPLATTYGIKTLAFAMNPVTGQPWKAGELELLEPMVQSASGSNGDWRVTLFNAVIDYQRPTGFRLHDRIGEGRVG